MTVDGWATARPKVRGTKAQKQALPVALGKMMLPKAQRAVLDVLAEHVGGTGHAWPSIATIAEESGYRRAHVCRAIRQLCEGDDPLLERQRFLRSAENTPNARSARARRGQGATTYRLGPKLRAAAGLYEIPDETPKIRLLDERVDETPKDETPKIAEKPCTLGSLIAAGAPKNETPERWNENKPSMYEAVDVEEEVEVGPAPARESELQEQIERTRLAQVAARERTRLAGARP